jgi:hypothetical protein
MSVANRVEKIYKRHIRPLSVTERLQLLELTVHDLVDQPNLQAANPKRNIMELHGLGKEIWKDTDAQDYVDKLRGEWDHRP